MRGCAVGNVREQARWTRARLGRCGPSLDLLTARFDRHEYAPHAHDEYTVGVTVCGRESIAYRGGRIVSGSGSIVVLEPGEMHTGGPAAPDGYAYRALHATPASSPTASDPRRRPVPWSTRQTSRADGRVDSLTGLPEERPGSTGQGGG